MATTDEFAPVSDRKHLVTLTPGSWHNRYGEVLRKLNSDVYLMERGYVDHGMDVGGKTTIIRLPGNRLFAHSVLPLDRETRRPSNAIRNRVNSGSTKHAAHRFVKCWKKLTQRDLPRPAGVEGCKAGLAL